MSKKKTNFAAENGEQVIRSFIVTPANYQQIREKCSNKPIKTLVPGEAMSIKEMLVRTERGQRLNVHMRMNGNLPDNMYPVDYLRDEFGRIVTDKEGNPIEHDYKAEGFENTPPDDINDIVDVQRFKEAHEERKKAFKERQKKTVANARESVPADEMQPLKKQNVEERTSEA